MAVSQYTRTLPVSPTPLSRWPRRIIAAAVDALLDELDRRDGDPDLEPELPELNGDEGDYFARLYGGAL